MRYLEFNSSIAENYIRNHDEKFSLIGESIRKKADYHPNHVNNSLYLEGEFTIEDFSPSYDEMVEDFLETCIPTFALFVKIEHGLDGNISKIILY